MPCHRMVRYVPRHEDGWMVMGMAEDIGKAVIIIVYFAFLYFCFNMEDLL